MVSRVARLKNELTANNELISFPYRCLKLCVWNMQFFVVFFCREPCWYKFHFCHLMVSYEVLSIMSCCVLKMNNTYGKVTGMSSVSYYSSDNSANWIFCTCLSIMFSLHLPGTRSEKDISKIKHSQIIFLVLFCLVFLDKYLQVLGS